MISPLLEPSGAATPEIPFVLNTEAVKYEPPPLAPP